MGIDTNQEKIDELLARGVEEIIAAGNLRKRLLAGERLRVKLGIDPTSPNIHLGRSIPLLKLKDFQALGHKIILLIGDFTGVIGDTSDKDSERPMLTDKQVKANMKTYIDQAAKIIDIKKADIVYNSRWLGKLNYFDICRQADEFSVNEFISRENIKRRLAAGKRVSLREVLYPLMQGYDSVELKADVEVGGTDQRFNLLAGRALQKVYGQPAQDIVMNPLIEGLDGRKMSSSWGNTVNLFDEPNQMFGKIMSLRDEFIIKYFTMLTRLDLAQVKKYEAALTAGENPRDIKIQLAAEICRMYHGQEAADKAQEYFVRVISNKEQPEEIPVISAAGKSIVEVLTAAKLAGSNSEARRLIKQQAVKMNGQVVADSEQTVEAGAVIQKGKRFFIKIK